MEPVSPARNTVMGTSHLELAEVQESSSDALVSYYSSNRFSQSASCEQASTIHLPPHFISFLTVAQDLGIDLCSFKWQPALERVGEGRTAEISQASIKLHTNFAFKRIKPATPSQLAERRAFQAIYTEVSILGLRRIRNHPNMIRLEGICWDVWEEKDRGTPEVWPVLVFEKTPYGDLDTFLRSTLGQNLKFEERLQLCSGIASAVSEMHAHHVIHGDIKPANILIFRDDSNRYIAKVADFGYSTVGTENGLVYLPKSVPWNAPEHHGRDFTFQSAMNTDTYSFGLVCLRILFEDLLLQHVPKFSEAYEKELFLLGKNRIVEIPATAGYEADLLPFAIDAVKSKEGLELSQKKTLENLFNVTIARDPNLRSDDFSELQKLLSNDQDILKMLSYDRRKPALLSCHANFQITKSILFLVESHYLVRRYIVKCLEDFYTSSDCQICKQEVAFQLAFAYNVGFGAARDEEIWSRWLERSRRTVLDLKVAKQVAEQPYWRYSGEKLQDFDQSGYLRIADIVAAYHSEGRIVDAEKECRREIQDFEAGFGQNNVIIKVLKLQLASILQARGNFSGAEDILRTLIDEGETGLRPRDDDGNFLNIPNRLAIALYHQGKNREAMEILQKDIEENESRMEKGSRPILHSKFTLAMSLMGSGDYAASEKLFREVLERFEELLDPDDPEVLTATGNLARVLSKQGRYQEAEDLEVRTLEGRKKVLGPEHPDTLTSFSNLALVLSNQGKNEEAESKQRYALEVRQKLFGNMHPDTLTSLDNLAALIGRQGQRETAKAMHEDALEGRENLLGKEDPQTLASVHNLATVLDHLGKFEEAEKLYRQNLEISEKVLGKDNPDTFERMSHLAGVLQSQGQYKEAKEIYELALTRCNEILGHNHPLTLTIASNLALNHQRLGELQASEALYRGTLERSQDTMGLCHPKTLVIMGNLADLLRVEGKFEEATQINQELLKAIETTPGESHHATLTAAQNLAGALHAQKRHIEAVPFYIRACGGLRVLLGPDHPQTMECFRNYFGMIQAMSEEEIQASS